MRYAKVLIGFMLALLVVGVVAGIGWTAYNAGVAQGLVESGKIVPSSTGGAVVPVAPFGLYGPFGFHRPFGFGFGLLGCLVPLLFFLFLFSMFRLMFRPRWGRGWGGPWMRGGWDPAHGDIPPGVQEWHRKLHEQDASSQPPGSTPTA